jgi:PKD repeat protein
MLAGLDKGNLEGYGYAAGASKVYQSPFYQMEIPSHWAMPEAGYNWDSWDWWWWIVTDMGPYDFWTDIGIASICANTSEDPEDATDVEVYCDNHGIAGVTVVAPAQTGAVTITATAEYPYCPKKGKYPPRVSDEITVSWGAKVLNPHFIADKTTVEVGETVTFSNETTGGTHPYTDAWWNFGDGSPVMHITGTEAVVMDDVTHAYAAPGIYTVTLKMKDITGEERTEFKEDYIIVEGEGELPGDANGDGAVNALDITYLEMIIAGLV